MITTREFFLKELSSRTIPFLFACDRRMSVCTPVTLRVSSRARVEVATKKYLKSDSLFRLLITVLIPCSVEKTSL